MSVTLSRFETRRACDLELLEICFEITRPVAGTELPTIDVPHVGEVRKLATRWASGLGLAPDLVGDVELILSELTTNAVIHSGGDRVNVLVLFQHAAFVRVAVSDGTTRRPVLRRPGHDSEHGRGLQLVDWIAAERAGSWGVSDDGGTAWCLLTLGEGGGFQPVRGRDAA
ncbi:ATP-binding protein [Streptomyces xiamenensis]